MVVIATVEAALANHTEMPLSTHKSLVVMGTLSDGEQVDLIRGITWYVDNDVVEIIDNVVKVNTKEQRW